MKRIDTAMKFGPSTGTSHWISFPISGGISSGALGGASIKAFENRQSAPRLASMQEARSARRWCHSVEATL
ncbi:hypothetical protein, partial [Propionibacterium freudenreichii]|uniref:hypothetical protein n=1 Tax=Propionibacterium freudenreichii TaxID=1744 RepID=UPI001E28CA42